MNRRRSLRQREVREFLSQLAIIGIDQGALSSKTQVETLQVDDGEILFVDKTPFFTRKLNRILPSLRNSDQLTTLPQIVVDMGAVSHVCNGADVMAKGVVRVEKEFVKDALVVIVDEKHGKPLAVGTSLLDSSSMRVSKSGRVVKNEHYVGDQYWQAMKNA
jgi:PUA-domain protein